MSYYNIDAILTDAEVHQAPPLRFFLYQTDK